MVENKQPNFYSYDREGITLNTRARDYRFNNYAIREPTVGSLTTALIKMWLWYYLHGSICKTIRKTMSRMAKPLFSVIV